MSDRVTLLFTSDLHGRLGHVDPLTQRDFPGGATRVATHLAEVRARVPDAIYLDLGDLAGLHVALALAAQQAVDDREADGRRELEQGLALER